MSFKLTPEQRLHEGREFSAVLAGRCVIRGKIFELHFKECSSGKARLGLIISKRLARSACLRNALKRQIRESFRHAASGKLPEVDLVVRLARPVKCSARDLAQKAVWRSEVEGLLQRLSVPTS